MSEAQQLERALVVELEQIDGYEFKVRFDEPVAELTTDESPPLGTGRGPSPSRLLAAAVGNCLAASLLFCLQKSRVEGARVRARVDGRIVRNDDRRWRIGGLDVAVEVAGLDEQGRSKLARCGDLFEQFCIVTESVRSGIPIEVRVDEAG